MHTLRGRLAAPILWTVLSILLGLAATRTAGGQEPTTYDIGGAHVATFITCSDQGRMVYHALTATDGQPQTYNLILATDSYTVATVGPVTVRGQRLIWSQHYPGDRAAVQYVGGPCEEGAPELSDRWIHWMPIVAH